MPRISITSTRLWTSSSFETLNGGSGQDTFDVDGNQNITLVGGAGNDAFILYNGAQVTSLNGQGGNDTLEYYDYTGPIDINTVNGTATNVPGGIGSIEVVMRAFRQHQLLWSLPL